MKRPCKIGIATLAILATTLGGRAFGADGPYPRDVTEQTLADPAELARLEKPGKVFFREGFDSAASLSRWYNRGGEKEGRLRVVFDPPLVHSGRGALEMRTVDRGGRSCGAGANYWFHPGYDKVYLRYYLRFAEDYDQGNLNHVGGALSGVAGSNRWAGMGGAGLRPRGDDRFSASFEPWRNWGRNPPPGEMMFYTYWMDMRRDRDGHYWGNMFFPPKSRRIIPKRGVWYCFEQMIKANTPGKADGELAGWINGRLYIHVKGFRWRTTADVRLKRIFLELYIHRSRRPNAVWYDDVALSTGYIGPMR